MLAESGGQTRIAGFKSVRDCPDFKRFRDFKFLSTTFNRVESVVMRTIYFYKAGDQYGEFSNFAAYPIRLFGKLWPTSEHYYQSQKFVGTPYAEAIRHAKSPAKAAGMGRTRDTPLRADWDDVKVNVMKTALQAKFEQHPSLSSLLISTVGANLVEKTTTDLFWGVGESGNGLNMLGKLLMQLRDSMLGIPS